MYPRRVLSCKIAHCHPQDRISLPPQIAELVSKVNSYMKYLKSFQDSIKAWSAIALSRRVHDLDVQVVRSSYVDFPLNETDAIFGDRESS